MRALSWSISAILEHQRARAFSRFAADKRCGTASAPPVRLRLTVRLRLSVLHQRALRYGFGTAGTATADGTATAECLVSTSVAVRLRLLHRSARVTCGVATKAWGVARHALRHGHGAAMVRRCDTSLGCRTRQACRGCPVQRQYRVGPTTPVPSLQACSC